MSASFPLKNFVVCYLLQLKGGDRSLCFSCLMSISKQQDLGQTFKTHLCHKTQEISNHHFQISTKYYSGNGPA